MTYEVQVIADSIAPCGKRLTTITATYPRFIHSEVLTHRDRARNSASSRAIPFPTLCERVNTEPVIPLQWLSEQRGMQGGAEIPEPLRPVARAIWLKARDEALKYASMLHHIEATAYQLGTGFNGVDFNDLGITNDQIAAIDSWIESQIKGRSLVRIHKSLPNRIIEPWMWITVVMSATEWNNFFRLRCHKDAEIHFQKIAGMIREEIANSIPYAVQEGEWHQPFVKPDDIEWCYQQGLSEWDEVELTLNKISAARCARVSYLTHDGKRDNQKDLELFEKLNIGSGEDLPHASPYEHVAQALATPERSGPFIGWKQFRKFFPNENVEG